MNKNADLWSDLCTICISLWFTELVRGYLQALYQLIMLEIKKGEKCIGVQKHAQ